MEEQQCPKCNGTGRVRNKDGTIQTCMDCLLAGRLDAHSKEIPDSKIKI